MESAAPPPVGELVEGLFRREAGRMVAALVRVFGPARLELAEDVVQEALLRALREWPFRGIPAHPQGWIVRVARNRAVDLLRREAVLERRWAELGAPGEGCDDAAEVFFAGEVEDAALRLLFTCCHPAVPRDARVALTLKAVGGFGVPEIARAFLAREDAVAQRIVRARRRIRAAAIDFAVPAPAELPARLDTALEVLYLVFTEGHAAAGGDELLRAGVCAEATRLARRPRRGAAAGGAGPRPVGPGDDLGGLPPPGPRRHRGAAHPVPPGSRRGGWATATPPPRSSAAPWRSPAPPRAALPGAPPGRGDVKHREVVVTGPRKGTEVPVRGMR